MYVITACISQNMVDAAQASRLMPAGMRLLSLEQLNQIASRGLVYGTRDYYLVKNQVARRYPGSRLNAELNAVPQLAVAKGILKYNPEMPYQDLELTKKTNALVPAQEQTSSWLGWLRKKTETTPIVSDPLSKARENLRSSLYTMENNIISDFTTQPLKQIYENPAATNEQRNAALYKMTMLMPYWDTDSKLRRSKDLSEKISLSKKILEQLDSIRDIITAAQYHDTKSNILNIFYFPSLINKAQDDFMVNSKKEALSGLTELLKLYSNAVREGISFDKCREEHLICLIDSHNYGINIPKIKMIVNFGENLSQEDLKKYNTLEALAAAAKS